MLNKLSETYHVPIEHLVKDVHDCYVIEVEGKALYGFKVDNIITGEPIFCFAYDSYVTQEHYNLSMKVPGVELISPALDIDFRKKSFEDVVSGIKTNKSVLNGSKSREISAEVSDLTSIKLKEIVDEKGRKYQNAGHDKHEQYLLHNGYEGYITTGYVGDEVLYTLVWFTNGQEYVGTNILCNDNMKKYSPSIVGHYWLIKHAHDTNISLVRFSLFYPYKAIFGVEPTMYPAIRWEDFMTLQPIPMKDLTFNSEPSYNAVVV